MEKSNFYLEVSDSYSEALEQKVKEYIDMIDQEIIEAAKNAEDAIVFHACNHAKDVAKGLVAHYNQQGFRSSLDWDVYGCYQVKINWRKNDDDVDE